VRCQGCATNVIAATGEDARSQHEARIEPWPPAIRDSIALLFLLRFVLTREASVRAKDFANLANKVVATVDVPG
jgi:hypothetical protein